MRARDACDVVRLLDGVRGASRRRRRPTAPDRGCRRARATCAFCCAASPSCRSRRQTPPRRRERRLRIQTFLRGHPQRARRPPRSGPIRRLRRERRRRRRRGSDHLHPAPLDADAGSDPRAAASDGRVQRRLRAHERRRPGPRQRLRCHHPRPARPRHEEPAGARGQRRRARLLRRHRVHHEFHPAPGGVRVGHADRRHRARGNRRDGRHRRRPGDAPGHRQARG